VRSRGGLHDAAADVLGYLGDDGVSEAAQSVHPSGNPMSHSTHVGFNAPLMYVPFFIADLRAFEPRALSSALAAPGVGNIGPGHLPLLAIAGSGGTAVAPGDGDWLDPYSVAVGYITRALSGSELRRCCAGPPLFAASWVVGVGHDEDPVAEVRGTDGGSRDAVPFRVVPELGQISENSSEPQGKVPWHVLQQRPSGS
jgi:hypothetical protein